MMFKFITLLVACFTAISHACDDNSQRDRINDEWDVVLWGKTITGDDAFVLTASAIMDALGGSGTFTAAKLEDMLGDQLLELGIKVVLEMIAHGESRDFKKFGKPGTLKGGVATLHGCGGTKGVCGGILNPHQCMLFKHNNHVPYLAWRPKASDTTDNTGGYIACAAEGQTCSCDGIARFGSGNEWAYASTLDSIECSIDGFGGTDPAVDTKKSCECMTNPKKSSTGYICASEGKRCHCPIDSVVRFGANGNHEFVHPRQVGKGAGVNCELDSFPNGDPAPQQVKVCTCAAPHVCATEGNYCICPGGLVLFGNGGPVYEAALIASKGSDAGVWCTLENFQDEDPAPQETKECTCAFAQD